MVTQIAWINDPTPTSYATAANYKRITVTVTRNLDSKQLIRSVTYVAPSTRAPYGGINNAIINATVTDYALSTPLENATVSPWGRPERAAERRHGRDRRGDLPGADPDHRRPALLRRDRGACRVRHDARGPPTQRPGALRARTRRRPRTPGSASSSRPRSTSTSRTTPSGGTAATSGSTSARAGGRSAEHRLRRRHLHDHDRSTGEKIIPGVAYTVGVLKETSPGPVALLRAVDHGRPSPPAIRRRSRRRSA